MESRFAPHIFMYVLVILYGLPPSTGSGGPCPMPRPSPRPHPVLRLACQTSSGRQRVPGVQAGQDERAQVRGSILLSGLGFCGATSMTSWTSNWPAAHLSAMASRCPWRLAFPSPGTQARCPASVCCCPRFLGPVARSCRSFAAIASPGVRWRVGRGVFLSLQSSAEDLGLVQFGLMSKPLAIGYPSSGCRTRRDRRGRSGRG